MEEKCWLKCELSNFNNEILVFINLYSNRTFYKRIQDISIIRPIPKQNEKINGEILLTIKGPKNNLFALFYNNNPFYEIYNPHTDNLDSYTISKNELDDISVQKRSIGLSTSIASMHPFQGFFIINKFYSHLDAIELSGLSHYTTNFLEALPFIDIPYKDIFINIKQDLLPIKVPASWKIITIPSSPPSKSIIIENSRYMDFNFLCSLLDQGYFLSLNVNHLSPSSLSYILDLYKPNIKLIKTTSMVPSNIPNVPIILTSKFNPYFSSVDKIPDDFKAFVDKNIQDLYNSLSI